MSVRTLARSFAAGEITPELYGRIDLPKFQQGLATCRNFITLPHGPAMNRPGFQFVRETKNSAAASRLIPFAWNNQQTFAIELGAGYFRFHTNGATLLSGGVPYEVANSYAAADLFDIHYVQSADVLTLVHPNYPPQELRRLGATNWTLTHVALDPGIAAPAATAGTGSPITHTYVVTAMVRNQTGDMSQFGSALLAILNVTPPVETLPSNVTTCSNDLTITGAYNTLSWSAVTDASSYRIYKLSGGLYGYLGTAQGTSFTDDRSHAPDTSQNPPIAGATGPTGAAAAAHSPALNTVTATATGTGSTTYTYVVTSVHDEGTLESLASSAASCTNNLLTTGNYNTITWPAVNGANRYNVYKQSNGLYGYVGTAVGTSFVDDNIAADLSQTPPVAANPFAGAGNYPAAVSYFEQRRCFAGTLNRPQNLWMTKSGTESSMSYSIPTRDDDRIAIRIAAREASAVRHIVPVANLLLLTASCEWRVSAANSDVLTPTSISVRPQSYIGASNVSPIVVGNAVLYAQARGGHLREMSYSWQANGYVSNDISILAPHLFDYATIIDLAYARAPFPIVWAVSSSGKLLGMTYVPESEVAAWHQHDTDGTFEAICAITENNEDMLYAIVNRTINGATKRYVERLHTRHFDAQADAFFVDCGLTYSGAPAAVISGLSHLEGKTVNILGDGAVMPQAVVTGGQVTLQQAASTVQVGLPITADLETLPLAMQVDNAFGQGRPKNLNAVWMRVYRSSGIFAGPSFDRLTEAKQRTTEPYGSPPALKSDEIKIAISPSWQAGGQLCVRQVDPLPLTVVSLTLEVAVGG